MRILHIKKRSVVYAGILCIGILLELNNLRTLQDKYFYWTAVILYLVLIFELAGTRFYAKEVLNQYALPPTEDRHRFTHLIHHLALPTLLYLGLIGYIFFNHIASIDLFLVTISFILFYLLFNNIRSHFENKYVLEEKTNSIYDLISIISLFFLSDTIIRYFIYAQLNKFYILIPFISLQVIYAIFSKVRLNLFSQKNIKELIYYLLFQAILIGLITINITNIFPLAIFNSLLLYYYIAYLQHKKDNSFTKQIVFEYVIVLLLLITLFIGIL